MGLTMLEVVVAGGERIIGSERAEDIAQGWIDAGLTPAQADAYIEAGCWDERRVAQLVAAGVTPEQVADEDVARAVTEARYQATGGNWTSDDWADSIPYLHSNGDISTAEIVAAVAAVRS